MNNWSVPRLRHRDLAERAAKRLIHRFTHRELAALAASEEDARGELAAYTLALMQQLYDAKRAAEEQAKEAELVAAKAEKQMRSMALEISRLQRKLVEALSGP